MKKRNEEFSIKELIDLFLPKSWIILIVSLLFSLAFGSYSAFIKDETYTSSTQLMVIKKTSSQISSSDIDLASRLLDTYKIVLSTNKFLTLVVDDISNNPEHNDEGWNINNKYISSHMSFTAMSNDVFDVSITTDNPKKSYAIATAVSNTITNEELNLLAYPTDLIEVTVIESADIGVANSKNVVRNAFIGFICGAAASMVVIFLYSMFDVVIRDKKRLEESFDFPVLGVIPAFRIEEDKK